MRCLNSSTRSASLPLPQRQVNSACTRSCIRSLPANRRHINPRNYRRVFQSRHCACKRSTRFKLYCSQQVDNACFRATQIEYGRRVSYENSSSQQLRWIWVIPSRLGRWSKSDSVTFCIASHRLWAIDYRLRCAIKPQLKGTPMAQQIDKSSGPLTTTRRKLWYATLAVLAQPVCCNPETKSCNFDGKEAAALTQSGPKCSTAHWAGPATAAA